MSSSPEILILSQGSSEGTTEAVMDWLDALGARCLRINGEDIDRDADVTFELTADHAELRIKEGSAALPTDGIKVVWHRRWAHERRFESVELFDAESKVKPESVHLMVRQLRNELKKTSATVTARFRDAFWLNDPDSERHTKLDVLEKASHLGIDIPATLLTTSKAELERFAARYDGLITKAVSDVFPLNFEDGAGMMYTTVIDERKVTSLPETFFPSLFQEKIDKKYELRVFFLDGTCYPMAIFSQENRQTEVDFRRYDRERPNRTVPYRLSDELEAKIVALMAELGMDTGSLDLIKATDGRDVLLEINPVGQFGMVSSPCNYHLERRVAEFLMSKATDEER